jgi:hypothetical protein
MVEEPSTTKNDDSICHEVKYDPADKASESYKKYMTAFSHGMPEQWLRFMENLNVVIRGNGLDENGHARFNLTRSSLKGDALRIFNDKAAEQEKETKDSHIKCLCAIMEQVFPKDNPLQKQKTYMRNHVFLHLNDNQVSEFCTQWKEINNWLDEFPPFEPNQHFPDDQVKEILYSIIPKRWQSYLHGEDKFNMTKASADDFFDLMERYQLANQLDRSLKQQNQSKNDKDDTKKSTEKSNDKKRKAQTKKEDFNAPAPKKSCLIHGLDSSHTTNECQIMQEQAYWMKEAYKNSSPAERSCQKRKRKQQKKKDQNELHEMIMKEVQQSMQTMFKQMYQHHCSDNDSDIDEAHHIEAMEDITVSECYNLSDLRQPPTKKTKTQHFAPITTAILGTHVGKSSIHKLRVSFNSGSSGSIIVAKFVKNLHIENDTKTEWLTKGGSFHTSGKCTTNFILNEFYESKVIEWILHVDKTFGPHRYDMIIGHDLMSQLRIILNFDGQTMTWDKSTIRMKELEDLLDINSPINEFYWHEEIYESQALIDASSHLKKILDMKYEPADLNKIAHNCDYLTDNEQMQLLSLLHKYQHLFNGSLGTWNAKPCNIELKPDAKPYHSRPFLVPKIHEVTLKIDLECLTKAGVLKKVNRSKWAEPTFLIPKKDATV